MVKILFVCHGNICRSPMAQFVLQHMVDTRGLTERFYIDSAATSTEEIGNGIHYGTMSIFRQYNIPCAGHRARQITKREYGLYDYLIGMDDANIRNMTRIFGGDPEHKIHKLLEYAGSSRAIADPWYTGEFDVTYGDVLEGCEAFLKHLLSQSQV